MILWNASYCVSLGVKQGPSQRW